LVVQDISSMKRLYNFLKQMETNLEVSSHQLTL
jgi:hypothetical protein